MKAEEGMSRNALASPRSIFYLLLLTFARQTPATPVISSERPGGELTPLEETLPVPKTDHPGFILPVVPPPAEDSKLSDQIKVYINRIELIGNTVFSDEELKKISSEYEARELTSDDLQALRLKLTRHYIKSGYINSGATIPDQEVADGILTIKIIEGRLTTVFVSGTKHLRDGYVENRLIADQNDILNIERLQEKILILHQDRLIKKINANLSPGIKPGEAVLDVVVEESRPYDLGFLFDNRRAPSVGELHGSIWVAHYNLGGYGDGLYMQHGMTEGLDDHNLEYSLPVNAMQTRLNIAYKNSDSEVIEEPFNSIDIRSNTESFEVGLSHLFIQKPGSQLTGSITFSRNRSESFLLGIPFSFSPGTINGESTVSVLRFGLDWTDRRDNRVVAMSSRLNIGIDALGSTINDDDIPDSKFISFLNQFQWVQRLPVYDAQLVFRTDLQLSKAALLSLEKFGIGGAYSVRGYRENELIRDYGIVSSIEVRIPATQFLSQIKQLNTDQLQIAAFTDIGWGEDINSDSAERKLLHSVGLGLRWVPNKQISGQLYWAHALKDIPSSEEGSLQEDGLHFRVDFHY